MDQGMEGRRAQGIAGIGTGKADVHVSYEAGFVKSGESARGLNR